MRYYTAQHRFPCGVDLHAQRMYVCIFDAAGEVAFARKLETSPKTFLTAIAPYRDDLVVACECLRLAARLD